MKSRNLLLSIFFLMLVVGNAPGIFAQQSITAATLSGVVDDANATDPFSIQAGGLRNDITIGIKSDYSLFLGSRHAVKAGIDLTGLRLREDFSFDRRENEIEIEPFDFRGRKTGGQASVYFQDQYKPFKNFTANLGLRYDQYSLVTNGHAFSPRINLAYALNGGRTVLHAAYNRFFAPPPIENLLLSARLGFEGQPPASLEVITLKPA